MMGCCLPRAHGGGGVAGGELARRVRHVEFTCRRQCWRGPAGRRCCWGSSSCRRTVAETSIRISKDGEKIYTYLLVRPCRSGYMSNPFQEQLIF